MSRYFKIRYEIKHIGSDESVLSPVRSNDSHLQPEGRGDPGRTGSQSTDGSGDWWTLPYSDTRERSIRTPRKDTNAGTGSGTCYCEWGTNGRSPAVHPKLWVSVSNDWTRVPVPGFFFCGPSQWTFPLWVGIVCRPCPTTTLLCFW